MKRCLLILCALAFAACDFDRFDAIDDFEDVPLLPNAELSVLRRAYTGTTAEIRGDVVVEGRVVSSDAEGNFYRSLVVEDSSGAVEVMVGLDRLHRIYPVGSRLVLRLQGLALGQRDGVLQVGLLPETWDYRATGYMSHQAVADNYIFRDTDIVPVEPERIAVGELTSALCGRLVIVERVAADDEAQCWAEGDYRCCRKFRDARGDSVYVAVSPYARFADRPIPRDTVSVTGILMYGTVAGSRNGFMIKISDEDAVR